MDGITKLAKLFKERENVVYLGPITGIVLSPPPDIKVSLGDNIILTNEDLIISAHVLADYQRNVEITATSGDMSFHLKNNPPPNDYTITNLTVPGTIKYTNTLVAGDEVILIPAQDEQTYFLVAKAVRL